MIGNIDIERKLKDFANSPYGASAFLHVYLDLGFAYNRPEQIYKDIFIKYGVNNNTLEFCGCLCKELVRRKIIKYNE